MIAKGWGRDVEAACAVTPSANFAVVTQSRADEVPVTLLLDRNGQIILKLETADISALPDNWQWPEPVRLVAADGITDIYGLVFRPSDFSPKHSYPVVSSVYNTPDLPRVSKGSFSNGATFGSPYLNAAALAELGFIVVQIDGRGTPFRSKAFHDESYGCTESASNLDDHIAGIQQLAKRYPYMDLERVGVTSHPFRRYGRCKRPVPAPEFLQSRCRYDRLTIADCSAPRLWGEKYEGISGPSALIVYILRNLRRTCKASYY